MYICKKEDPSDDGLDETYYLTDDPGEGVCVGP